MANHDISRSESDQTLLSQDGSSQTPLTPEPYFAKQHPFYQRAAYFVTVWTYKGVISLALSIRRLFVPKPKDELDPEVKTYEIRPDLKHRIFHPPNHGSEKLPVYLDCHGGGWAVADPRDDDEFCSFMVKKFNIVVISVDYHLAPRYKFPHAVDDIAAIASAILDDETLNIDNTKVALGGFSAGGNLAFAAAQSETLRGRIGGVVGFYAALDLAESMEAKLSRRPENAPSDLLAFSGNWLAWAYVPEGVDLRDPLVSPRWASPEALPSHVYLVGSEYDMLCSEANVLAENLAKATRGKRRGISLPDIEGWQQGGIRWECAKGKEHAFTHIKKWGPKNEKRRVQFCEDMYCRIGSWLMNEAWAAPDTS